MGLVRSQCGDLHGRPHTSAVPACVMYSIVFGFFPRKDQLPCEIGTNRGKKIRPAVVSLVQLNPGPQKWGSNTQVSTPGGPKERMGRIKQTHRLTGFPYRCSDCQTQLQCSTGLRSRQLGYGFQLFTDILQSGAVVAGTRRFGPAPRSPVVLCPFHRTAIEGGIATTRNKLCELRMPLL